MKIVRAEHLRFPRVVDSERVERLRLFRKRLGEASPTVTEEAVIVTLKVDDVEITKDHIHANVTRFKDLIDHKKAAGYRISIKDGVDAYLLVWGAGSKSMIAGFLWAMSDEYPEFRYTSEEVEVTETYKTLTGEVLERKVKKRPGMLLKTPEELAEVVGVYLSRMLKEPWRGIRG